MKLKSLAKVAAYTLALPLFGEVSGCNSRQVDESIAQTEQFCRRAYGNYYDTYRGI